MPGEQVVQLSGGMIGHAVQHFGEPSLQIAPLSFTVVISVYIAAAALRHGRCRRTEHSFC
jgi:hypothetical protein